MPEPTDLDREELAFRAAFADHAGKAPDEPLDVPSARPGRRTRWAVLGAAAACVVALVVVPLALSRGGDDSAPPADRDETAIDAPDTQWVSFHGIEVAAPAGWAYDYDAIRPDCISEPTDPNDAWAGDVPRAPYVMVGGGNRAVPMIGCFREPQPDDPDPAFGALPFVLWQPYVKLDEARPDLTSYPDRVDGTWGYRGWTLLRQSQDGVQITVLAPSSMPDLGDQVMDSIRDARYTSLGCDTESPAQSPDFPTPTGGPVPAPDEVAAAAVCEYTREDPAGLVGSRRITGADAADLARAITDARTDEAPGDLGECRPGDPRDDALTLRFFADADETQDAIGEAYVYFDQCSREGIVDSASRYDITRANCAPLFDRPPITFWGGAKEIFEACHTNNG